MADFAEPTNWPLVQWWPHGRPIPAGWRKVHPPSLRIEEHHGHHAILIEEVKDGN